MRPARAELDSEFAAYEREVGEPAAEKLYRSLAAVVRWLREHGHGRCVLSAFGRILGDKLKMITYRRVK